MDEDAFEQYVQYNIDDLQDSFCEKNSDEFDEFCFEQYVSAEADRGDFLYEMERDRQLEEGTLKED